MESNPSLSESQDKQPDIVEASSKLPSIRSFIGEVWDFYTANLSTFLTLALIPSILYALFSFTDGSEQSVVSKFLDRLEGQGSEVMILFVVLFVIAGIMNQVFQFLIPIVVAKIGNGSEMMEAVSTTLREVFSYIWIGILYAGISILGFILFVIPGIIIQISFTVAFVIAAVEGERGVNALIKSRHYVKGRWWAVFFRLFAATLVAIGILIVLVLGLSIITSPLPEELSSFILMFLIGLYFGPYMGATVYVLYKNLKSTRDLSQFIPAQKDVRTYRAAFALGMAGFIFAIGLIVYLTVSGAFDSATLRARDAGNEAIARTIVTSIEGYKEEVGSYPASLSDIGIKAEELNSPAVKNALNFIAYSAKNGGYKLCVAKPSVNESVCFLEGGRREVSPIIK